MKRKIYIILLLFAIVSCAGVLYKMPKAYFVTEKSITMCDETGETVIEVDCELYLQRYFFKASEVHGDIYVNGVKYTSLFDVEKISHGYINDNNFLAKMKGKKYIMFFVNEDYYAECRKNGINTDMFFRKESIDVGWSVYPDKGVIVFSYYDAEGKSTLYIGPAENAIEYDKIINDMFYY